MHDLLPAETPAWQRLEEVLREVSAAYGYEEIRVPAVEKTELFVRTIGEVTDIVEKEMYTFEDLSGDSLSLRPEGTAGCVRACIENGLLHGPAQRLWYMGPMFRHERPQKGRYRQFHQWGVEAYGLPGPDIDAEIILMTARLWRRLGIDGLQLDLNTLGSPPARARHRDALTAYFSAHRDELDADSQRRLERNPLRILDTKNPAMQALIEGAPRLADHLDDEAARHFEGVRALLDEVGIEYRINPRLVRGLDYYDRTVFEWTTDRLGAQGAVCAGGRYDRLIEQLGGQPTPAVGLAIGIERVLAVLGDAGEPPAAEKPHAYLIAVGDQAMRAGWKLSECLRDQIPGLRLCVNCGGGNFKTQFRRADRSGAAMALILGEDEVAASRISIKFLRDDRPQQTLAQDAVAEFLQGQF